MAPIPLIATLGGSLLGQGFSSYMAGRANKQAQDVLDRRINSLESAFKLDQNQNFLDSEEASSVMERLRDQVGTMTKRNERNALKTGQTAETQIATQDAATKSYGKALSDLSVYGRQKKDQNAFRYRGMLSSLYDRDMGVKQAKANNWNQLGQNFSNLGGTFLEAYSDDWFPKKEKEDES